MLGWCTTLFLATACSPAPEETTGEQTEATNKTVMPDTQTIDWQGHRGARGLLPENTIPAFLKALEYPVTTLELDVVISQDGKVVISHEPWMSAAICQQPDGSPIPEEEEQTFRIYDMAYAKIRAFDCGSKGNANFPEQTAMKVSKPLLDSLFPAVAAWCTEHDRPLPDYNIEIKSQPEWDGTFTPEPNEFAKRVLTIIEQAGVRERTCIQSFDARALRAVHELDPDMTTAWLVADTDGLEVNLNELGFLPTIYSPYYKLVTANVVKEAHERGLKIIPWTVNEVPQMRALISMGVDGIITDYPNRIAEAVK